MKEKNETFKVLVTAGPTREPIDPVRFLSNRSTGSMGYAIAAECKKRGFDVCLISGPVALTSPEGIETIRVETAEEMKRSVETRIVTADCLIMAAAVSDFRAKTREKSKIKKRKDLKLELEQNPDILAGLRNDKNLVRIGFALETDAPLENGRKKLTEKNLALIVINAINPASDPFGQGKDGKGENDYTLMTDAEEVKNYPGTAKKEIAAIIAGEAMRICNERFD